MKKHIKILSLLLSLILIAGCTSAPVASQPEAAESSVVEPPVESSVAPVAEEEPPYTSLDDFVLYGEDGVLLTTGRDATGEQAVVSSGKYETSKIGIEIIEQGGNAVDAAVAVGFALGLAEPNASGLGGGGFVTLYLAETKESIFINFREKAPENATPEMWVLDAEGKVVDNEKAVGGKSVGVPGQVAGMLHLLENYGTMEIGKILAPTIELAKNGITVTPTLNNDMTNNFDKFQLFPESQGTFYKDVDGLFMPYEVNDTFVNLDYIKTLELIAEHGFDGFYKGEVAQAIVDSVNKYNGVFTMEDMANYEATELEPVIGNYRGYDIISAPPPSSGGTILVEILNILENFDLPNMEDNSAEELHLFAEAFKLAYADRGEHMGDTNYVEVPLAGLISKDYAKTLAAKISTDSIIENVMPDDPWMFEHEDTTHFSVADKAGNIVSVTQTVNSTFGSGVTVDGYGFVMNNEMNDFSAEPDHINSIAGGKIPLSSMSPTILLKDGNPFAVMGAPGGTTIISTTALIISNLVDHGMGMQEAVDAPRISGYRNSTISYESRIAAEVIATMEALGHICNESDEWNRGFGSVNAISYGDDGLLYGAADPRRDGKALGY